jgi:hypothetical protein
MPFTVFPFNIIELKMIVALEDLDRHISHFVSATVGFEASSIKFSKEVCTIYNYEKSLCTEQYARIYIDNNNEIENFCFTGKIL